MRDGLSSDLTPLKDNSFDSIANSDDCVVIASGHLNSKNILNLDMQVDNADIATPAALD